MSSPHESTDPSRLLAIEERLTFQQRLIEQLNEVVLSQSKQIERLGCELANYATAIERISQGSFEEAAPDEKPPHY